MVSFFKFLALPSSTPWVCASPEVTSSPEDVKVVAPLPGCLTIPKSLGSVLASGMGKSGEGVQDCSE